MSNKLLPCPFCGESKGRVMRFRDGITWPNTTYLCRACGARGPVKLKVEDSIEVWNRRAWMTKEEEFYSRHSSRGKSLDADQTLCDAATEGPWVIDAGLVGHQDEEGGGWSEKYDNVCIFGCGLDGDEAVFDQSVNHYQPEWTHPLSKEDATFIAAARTGWPDAIDELQEERGWIQVVIQSNNAVDALLRKYNPGLPEHYGMPVDGLQLTIDHIIASKAVSEAE